jgi:hypothetical protein
MQIKLTTLAVQHQPRLLDLTHYLALSPAVLSLRHLVILTYPASLSLEVLALLHQSLQPLHTSLEIP